MKKIKIKTDVELYIKLFYMKKRKIILKNIGKWDVSMANCYDCKKFNKNY